MKEIMMTNETRELSEMELNAVVGGKTMGDFNWSNNFNNKEYQMTNETRELSELELDAIVGGSALTFGREK